MRGTGEGGPGVNTLRSLTVPVTELWVAHLPRDVGAAEPRVTCAEGGLQFPRAPPRTSTGVPHDRNTAHLPAAAGPGGRRCGWEGGPAPYREDPCPAATEAARCQATPASASRQPPRRTRLPTSAVHHIPAPSSRACHPQPTTARVPGCLATIPAPQARRPLAAQRA